MLVAIYGRYSTELQRETSIDDQVAVARRYAEQHGWTVMPDHIYIDAAVSGASIEGRPGLQALLAASVHPQSFDIVLVDDSSRIARDLADALRTMQLLKFRGRRVIYISQGIDSASEQADALVAMHGLVDQLYLKEMAKKIKRGLAGQLERGFVTGNKNYGYRTVGVPSGKTDVNGNAELLGKRRVICEEEATVIRQLFEWAASGVGVFTITRRLQETVSGPWGNPWTQGTIRRLLRNEVYLGKLIWGRVSYEREPGTSKMVRRKQPRSDWKVFETPELRIINDDLWNSVRERERTVRLALKGGNLARGRLPGHLSKYLFSGFLKCGSCGGAVAVVSSGRAAGPRYGCIRAHRQYTCDNRIEMKLATVEDRLLAKLQAELQRPEVTDYIVRETTCRAQQAPSGAKKRQGVSKELEHERKKLQNLVRALEDGEPSTTILAAIRKREESIKKLEEELATIQASIHPAVLDPDRIRQELSNLGDLLKASAERARSVFTKLNLQIRLFPVTPEGERPHLRAVGTASLNALAGEIPILRRSLARAGSAKSSSRGRFTS